MTTPYEPPTGDEPLDDIERALVRALVPILVRQIREELLADRQQDPDVVERDQQPSTRTITRRTR